MVYFSQIERHGTPEVCKCTIKDQVPKFNVRIFLKNKTQIGQVRMHRTKGEFSATFGKRCIHHRRNLDLQMLHGCQCVSLRVANEDLFTWRRARSGLNAANFAVILRRGRHVSTQRFLPFSKLGTIENRPNPKKNVFRFSLFFETPRLRFKINHNNEIYQIIVSFMLQAVYVCLLKQMCPLVLQICSKHNFLNTV